MTDSFVSCEIAWSPSGNRWEYWEGETLVAWSYNLDTIVNDYPDVPVDRTGRRSVD